jgi:hypothetical protein
MNVAGDIVVNHGNTLFKNFFQGCQRGAADIVKFFLHELFRRLSMFRDDGEEDVVFGAKI